jgi:pimeloyl-ACP methyl ester carboxylesterase
MSAAPDTIVLIHGLYLESRSWEGWAERYSSRGHRVLTPSWPGLEAGVEELRRDPTSLTQLDIPKIVDHYDKIVRELDRPPIIMGHSTGGTVMQLLLDRGLGAAGVGIEAATVKGIYYLPVSTLKASFPVLGNPLNRGKATMLTEKQFGYGFTNSFDDAAAKAAYDRYAIPCANRVLFQLAFANFPWTNATKVDFGNDDRAPLLFISGSEDHTVPAKIGAKLAKKHAKSKAAAEFKEYPGRAHFTMVQDGWEQVADYALDWAVEHATATVPAAREAPEGTRAMPGPA